MEIQFEKLYKQMNQVQKLIDDKKETRDNAILKYGNQILQELDNDLRAKLAALDKAFPFEEMKKEIRTYRFSSGYQHLFDTVFVVAINIDTKKIEYGYYSEGSSHYNTFRPFIDKTATFKEGEGYSLSTSQYEKFFKDENPYVFLTEAFDVAVNKLFDFLTGHLKKKQQEWADIFVPSFNFMDKKEEEIKDKIVIGSYQDYQVVLERK